MNDKELIEMAAKACGLPRQWWDYEYVRSMGHMVTQSMMWNPLSDDAAALKLAVKLHISIGFLWDGENDQYDPVTAHRGSAYAAEQIGITMKDEFDEDAATRRAIVCAAAQIGKAMP
ncbi:MAG: hypothetical protein [Bacteriophage sp.]|nr:MAG: hypothetical protein [Bacteriophage sp.]